MKICRHQNSLMVSQSTTNLRIQKPSSYASLDVGMENVTVR